MCDNFMGFSVMKLPQNSVTFPLAHLHHTNITFAHYVSDTDSKNDFKNLLHFLYYRKKGSKNYVLEKKHILTEAYYPHKPCMTHTSSPRVKYNWLNIIRFIIQVSPHQNS